MPSSHCSYIGIIWAGEGGRQFLEFQSAVESVGKYRIVQLYESSRTRLYNVVGHSQPERPIVSLTQLEEKMAVNAKS